MKERFSKCSEIILKGHPGEQLEPFIRGVALPIAKWVPKITTVRVDWNGDELLVEGQDSVADVMVRWEEKVDD